MARAGFVLVGGKSSRMGKNKAFLQIRNGTLADSAAAAVLAAAGNVTLIGDPQTYAHLGYSVLPDTIADAGPLAGIHAALQAGTDWNLVVACDMPALRPRFLRALLDRAENVNSDCLLPEGPDGRLEPLCAVYHKRCLSHIHEALRRGVRKVTDGLTGLRVHRDPVAVSGIFQNLNTPRDLESFLND